MKYWTVDIPYHSHRRRRASKYVAAMGYIWKLWSHSFPIQWISSAFLPTYFPHIKMWQNWAPYLFHIFTQPSHTIPRYGSYMAHALPYHSHTFVLVREDNESSKLFRRLLLWQNLLCGRGSKAKHFPVARFGKNVLMFTWAAQRVCSTRLKDCPLTEIPEHGTSTEGKEIPLSLPGDIRATLHFAQTHDEDTKAMHLAKATMLVRIELLDKKHCFNGSLQYFTYSSCLRTWFRGTKHYEQKWAGCDGHECMRDASPAVDL